MTQKPITVTPATVQPIEIKPTSIQSPVIITPVSGVPGPRGINTNITVSTTPPLAPEIGDVWIDIS